MTDEELRTIEPGVGVFWHEPNPPYHLWFGVVVSHEPTGEVSISIPGRGRLVRARSDRLHREVPTDAVACPLCQAAGTREV